MMDQSTEFARLQQENLLLRRQLHQSPRLAEPRALVTGVQGIQRREFTPPPTRASTSTIITSNPSSSSFPRHSFSSERPDNLLDNAGRNHAPTKKRKRKIYSCTNCYRLKAKCDRQNPCSGCAKRASTCVYEQSPTSEEPEHGESEQTATLSTTDPELEPPFHYGVTDNSNPPNNHFLVDTLPPRLATIPSASSIPGPSSIHRPSSHSSARRGSHSNENSREGSEQSGEAAHGYGTLILDDDGRARYLGPTAGSEWLREPEMTASTPFLRDEKVSISAVGTFPFPSGKANAHMIMERMLQELPTRDDAKLLIDCYYRHMSWNYDVVERGSMDEILADLYKAQSLDSSGLPRASWTMLHPHKMALFFIIIAVGAQYNLELAVNDHLSEHYCLISQQCLAAGDFMVRNTISGVQTLHVMGHFYLSSDQRGDSSWPLWGLSMRMIEAMGLHRDGSRWNLPEAQTEERRRVFWECHTADVLQANCFARPSCLQAGQFDTRMPVDTEAPLGAAGFKSLKFKLAQISLLVLNQVTRTKHSSYRSIQSLWKKIADFEADLPFYIRCRPAWSAIVSLNPPQQDPGLVCPEIRRSDFRLTFQQHTLALNICESVLSLQRPYFTQALCQSHQDIASSKYYSSFLAVFERCMAITALAKSLHSLYPALIYRHWNWFYHQFTAAVCFSTVIILAPTCFLAPFAMTELQGVVDIFAGAPPGSRARANLDALLNIQRRSQERFSTQDPPPDQFLHHMTAVFGMPSVESTSTSTNREDDEDEDEGHVPMMGWDTRLVLRLKAGAQSQGISIPGPTISPRYRSTKRSTRPSQPPSTELNPVPNHGEDGGSHAEVSPIIATGQGQSGVFNEVVVGDMAADWDFWADWFRNQAGDQSTYAPFGNL